jgi:hypothetical protein
MPKYPPRYSLTGEFIEDGYLENSFENSPYPTILNGHRTKLKLGIVDQLKYFLIILKYKKLIWAH